MNTLEAVKDFILSACDYDKPLSLEDDILAKIGITGDDTDDFLNDFANRFDVDLSKYIWYFHTEEEGFPSLFFKSPDQMVNRIPITVQILIDTIETKIWAVEYPDHDVPSVRKDVAFNWVVIVFMIVVGIFAVL